MKILHTADIHLKDYGDRRWQALQTILDTGEKEKISILAVSGDLFDQGADVLKLQDMIRKDFSGRPFTIVILPGNHDYAAYNRGIYLGENATILSDWQRPYIYGDVALWGLPFAPLPGVEILSRLHALNSRLSEGKRHYLLLHGELLDAFFSRRQLGDEGEERYMPVKLSYFKNLKFEHILAGHFHSGFRVWSIEDEGGCFVYPGSPAAITTREIGRRKVNLFAVGGPPLEYALATHHYEERIVKLDPFAAAAPLEQVEKELLGIHPAAEVILTVTGYINSEDGVDETELVQQIDANTSGRIAVKTSYEFRDIAVIFEDDIFKAFIKKLKAAETDAGRREQMLDLTVKAMMEARLCR